mgnify:CR=1 FL=1
MYTVINKMKIIFKTILILLIITISASPEIVKEIKVDGNERVSTETVKIFSGVKINSDLTSNQINDILKNLFSTNYFSNISINLKNNILFISVKENPIIQNVNFDGVKNKRILEVLNDQIELKEKNSFVENKVKNDVDKIKATQIRDLKVSPDGSKLAFTAFDRLYLMNLSDSIPKRLTNFNMTEAMPTWNSDGTYIAFVTWDEKMVEVFIRLIPMANQSQLS